MVDQRGIVLPLAMLVLFILTSLLVAMVFMTQQEPVIAGNQLRGLQARTLAESGLERALWALTNSGATGGLAAPAADAVAGAPYNGATFVTVDGTGGFTVKVTGVSTTQALIEAVGWAPTNDASGTEPRAHRKLTATAMRFPAPGTDSPCVICVSGPSSAGGSAQVSALTDTSCGNKSGMGVYGDGATLSTSGSAGIYGADGNATANQSTDVTTGIASDFNTFDLSTATLDALKAYAKSKGTYHQGAVTFNSSNRLPSSGVVFVDTVSGTNPTASTAASDLANVQIQGNAAPEGGFSGWVIVNGNVEVAGNYGGFRAFLYAAGTLSATGTGWSYIEGMAVSRRVLGGTSSIAGNADFRMSCAAANGTGVVPTAWFISPGSYREVSD